MILPKIHVFVTYVVRDLCKTERHVFTDNKTAQEFYSANSLTMTYPNWEVKEKAIPCDGADCKNCATATHTIEKWTDEIGHGMFRACAILPNSYGDRRARNILSAIARKHYASVGTPGKSFGWITGGAHINVKPGYTEWTTTYAL